MQQFLRLEKVVNLAALSLYAAMEIPAVPLLLQAAVRPAARSHHPPAAVFLAAADAVILANQLNVIFSGVGFTVRIFFA